MLTHPLKALALLAVFGTMSTQATSQVPSLKGGPKLSCAGGTVQGTSCVCPQGQEPIHVGAHAWRCREKKGPQLTGPPTLSCGGGTIQGTSCICPSGQEGVQVGEHAWRCVKTKDQQLAGPPTISCAGGTAKGTTCLCQRGQEAVKVGDNAWRCREKKGPQLTTGTVSCAGGSVQGTSCVCPVGQEPVQVANHSWRCRAKKGPRLTTPTIRCEGGRVMGARCVCPAGKHAEQGVCKSDRPTAPTDGKRYKLKVISGQPAWGFCRCDAPRGIARLRSGWRTPNIAHTSGSASARRSEGRLPNRRRNWRLKYDTSPNPASSAMALTVQRA